MSSKLRVASLSMTANVIVANLSQLNSSSSRTSLKAATTSRCRLRKVPQPGAQDEVAALAHAQNQTDLVAQAGGIVGVRAAGAVQRGPAHTGHQDHVHPEALAVLEESVLSVAQNKDVSGLDAALHRVRVRRQVCVERGAAQQVLFQGADTEPFTPSPTLSSDAVRGCIQHPGGARPPALLPRPEYPGCACRCAAGRPAWARTAAARSIRSTTPLQWLGAAAGAAAPRAAFPPGSRGISPPVHRRPAMVQRTYAGNTRLVCTIAQATLFGGALHNTEAGFVGGGVDYKGPWST